jgi:glc operon protein GlcG
MKMKKITLVLFLALSFGLTTQSFAQAGATPAPSLIDFNTAKALVEAATAEAKANNANVAIAVVDSNGDLVYFIRMDGASARAVTSSQGKARAAILFGLPTKVAADAVAAGTPLSATLNPSVASAFPIAVQQGGLPIIKDGKVIGGVGIGGASPASDEMFAQKGIDSIK